MQGVLDLCGLVENGRCGYCQGQAKTSLGEEEAETGRSCSLGLWAHRLPAKLYQDMIDCGWRRSGVYLYKPIMEKTCCPQYTIRLDTSKFFLSRSQKRVLQVMNDYLKLDTRPKSGLKEVDDVPASLKSDRKIKTKDNSAKNNLEGQPTKKKETRRQRCFEKWRTKGLDVEEMRKKRMLSEESRRRTIESFLIPYDSTWKHKLEVKFVCSGSEEFKKREQESFELYCKYQSTVHNDKNNTISGYKRFLCSDPFGSENLDNKNVDYGAYHQWYILDNKLIAVGVIDVLPHCLSSKYLFYDPDYNFLSLGTYTALREIEFIKRLALDRPLLKYYYMGYYIESCPKMRYKGKFQPSELLCDQSLTWVPLSECQKMFAAADSKYVVFSPYKAPRKTINNLILIANRRAISYADLPRFIPNYAQRESSTVKADLTLLASLLPARLSNNLLIFVGEINNLAQQLPGIGDSDSPEEDS